MDLKHLWTGLDEKRKKVAHRIVPPGGPDFFFDTTKLGDLSKWIAGGFTLLAGILTFFGIKEGYLDRVLRANARPALLVFCLVGLAVLLGTSAAILNSSRQVSLLLVLMVAGGLAGFTLVVLPNFSRDQDSWIGTTGVIVVVATGLVLVVLFFDRRLPTAVAASTIALVALTLGLYGAAKLSVESKISVDALQVTGSLEEDSGTTASSAEITDPSLDGHHVEVAVVDTSAPRGVPAHILARYRLFPDATGLVNKTLTQQIPAPLLSGSDASGISIRVRVCPDHRKRKPNAAKKRAQRCDIRRRDERVFLLLRPAAETTLPTAPAQPPVVPWHGPG